MNELIERFKRLKEQADSKALRGDLVLPQLPRDQQAEWILEKLRRAGFPNPRIRKENGL